MLTRRNRHWRGLVLAAIGAAVVAAACDLNPQPLPPGANAPSSFGGASEDAGTGATTPVNFGGADASTDAATLLPAGDGGAALGVEDGGALDGGEGGALDAGASGLEDAALGDAGEDAL